MLCYFYIILIYLYFYLLYFSKKNIKSLFQTRAQDPQSILTDFILIYRALPFPCILVSLRLLWQNNQSKVTYKENEVVQLALLETGSPTAWLPPGCATPWRLHLSGNVSESDHTWTWGHRELRNFLQQSLPQEVRLSQVNHTHFFFSGEITTTGWRSLLGPISWRSHYFLASLYGWPSLQSRALWATLQSHSNYSTLYVACILWAWNNAVVVSHRQNKNCNLLKTRGRKPTVIFKMCFVLYLINHKQSLKK